MSNNIQKPFFLNKTEFYKNENNILTFARLQNIFKKHCFLDVGKTLRIFKRC